jgi:hypothetical protein
MKKILLILLCLPMIGFGQATTNAIIFTDGKSIEGVTKNKFINGCAKKITEDNGGSFDNNKNLCECLMEEVSNNMTSLEYKNVFGYGLSNLVLNISESILEKSLDCVKNKGLLDEANFSPATFTKKQWEALAENTKKNLKSSLTSEQYKNFIDNVNINGYSECYIRQLYKSFTSEEMINIDVTDSATLVKIQSIEDKCIQQNLK